SRRKVMVGVGEDVALGVNHDAAALVLMLRLGEEVDGARGDPVDQIAQRLVKRREFLGGTRRSAANSLPCVRSAVPACQDKDGEQRQSGSGRPGRLKYPCESRAHGISPLMKWPRSPTGAKKDKLCRVCYFVFLAPSVSATRTR